MEQLAMTMADPILDALNERQREAVLNIHGPSLILAGAGSGKTKALTHRIAYLMQNGVEPWQILAVTFTNKAATEMKERIKNMLHVTEGTDQTFGGEFKQGRMPAMGTFHSICVRILRRDMEHLGRDRNFVIYDTDDQQKLMKEVLKELHIEESELKPKAALSYISRFKSEALSPKQAEAQATTDRMFKIIQAYGIYQKRLRESNALDFDDLIVETVRLFDECPEVLERYQRTWKYIHVDEYQDTNHAQYLLISQLAGAHKNLCVIGDPDQSIYGFRGADIRNILEFEKEYPNAVKIKLEQNYRSTQPILDAADGVISKNPNRPEKKMWTEQKEGPKIIVNEVSNERREAEEAIKAVQEMQRQGVELKEQVILYRTHSQSRLFEEACMRNGVPYRILGGIKFYARKEVKDVLAYLYVLLNPYDTVSLLRIVNVPSRKIGATTMSKLQQFASERSFPLWDALLHAHECDSLDNGVKTRIAEFTELIEVLREKATKMVVSDLARSLLSAINMEQYLRKESDTEEEAEDRWHNVQELQTVMHKYDELEPHLSLTSFLEEVALVAETDKLGDGTANALTLMTLHLCKGLEFEHVLIVGCEEGLFPHSNSLMDKEQMEEERRIMYVGMTRSKKHLRLLFAQSRFLWGENKSGAPSRFLDDLPDTVVERRSDEILSAFAWAGSSGAERARRHGGSKLEPFRQHSPKVEMEFNQDIDFDGTESQEEKEVELGSRIEHPTFGQGTVLAKRGDVVDIGFDGGPKKTFALSIAPLRLL